MTDDRKKKAAATDPPAQEPADAKQEAMQEQLVKTFSAAAAKEFEQKRRLIESLSNPAIDAIETAKNVFANFSTVNAMQDMVNAWQERINFAAGAFKTMQDYFNSEKWAQIRQQLQEIAEAAPAWLELATEIEELTPYLEAELKKPEYEGLTLDDLLNMTEVSEVEAGTEESLFNKVLAAARAARDADAAKEKPPEVAIKRAETVEYPLDKPNSIIWNLLEKDTKGQIAFNMAKSGSNKQIPAYYAINFEALNSDITITKRLLPFDKRVYIAISALFNAGNTIITLSQIHYAMGNTGRPAANQLEKINDSISKMTGAKIFFDNKQEAESLKGYARFKYDGSLLPLERGTAIVNGQLADAAIHIFREPPLISFAKQRKQITTVEVKLLQSPVSKTDANLLIDDYLIERISKAKNGKAKSCRILFKTLFDHTGTTTGKQKQRTPDKVKKYLTYYQQCGFISRYTIEPDGITVFWK